MGKSIVRTVGTATIRADETEVGLWKFQVTGRNELSERFFPLTAEEFFLVRKQWERGRYSSWVTDFRWGGEPGCFTLRIVQPAFDTYVNKGFWGHPKTTTAARGLVNELCHLLQWCLSPNLLAQAKGAS